MDPRSDTELLAAYLGGDEGAFTGLVARHSRALFRVAFAVLRSAEDANDLVQTAFVELMRAAPGLTGRPGSLEGWLRTVLRRDLIDHGNAARQRPTRTDTDLSAGAGERGSFLEEVPDPRPTGKFEPDELAAVRACRDRFPPRDREAFVLRHWERRTLREIADCFGETVIRVHRWLRELERQHADCVRSRLSRAEGGGGE